MYKIEQIQRVPIPKEEAWAFFSNPKNLKEVTPNNIGFSFADDLGEKMYKGMVVRYTVAPLFGVKLKWATEITAIMENDYFVDHQLSGPYKIWHHQHFFKQIKGGTELKDIVHYELPFGILGKLAHPLLVKQKLKEIFEYRRQQIELKFGTLS